MASIESYPPEFFSEKTSEIYPASDEGFNFRFENVSTESIYDLAETTIVACDEIFKQIQSCDTLTYDTILTPLYEIDDLVQQAFNQLSALSMLHADNEVRRAATDASKAVLYDSYAYFYNFDVNKQVLAYSRTEEAKELKGEQELYLNTTLDWLDYTGHYLPRSQRKKIKKLQGLLPELDIEFLKNIAEDNTTVTFSAKEVAGLDERVKQTLLIDLGDGSFGLNMIDSSYADFMAAAPNRDARQKAYKAFTSRTEATNRPVLQKVVRTRQKIAKLLGYESWLQLASEFNVAQTPDAIFDMYKQMIGPISAQAKQELSIMEEMLSADGHQGPIQIYDWQYYETKLFNAKYNLDFSKVREYFPLPTVLRNAHELTGEILELTYRPINQSTWHEDVLAFEVNDTQSSKPIGSIYMDLFPRDGKYKHCCTQTLIGGRALPDGSYRQPASLIIANLTRPVNGAPASLTQRQRVDVGHHEFAHALHDVLTKANIGQFAGLSTEKDFVEVPSQLMENWAWNKELIRKYSCHYKTGEPMPYDMIDALIDSNNLNVGIKYLHDISFAMFDLALHSSLDPIDIVAEWHKAVEISPYPNVEGTFYPAIFEHLVSDYGSNYYSYFYDQIFCSDMFGRFEQEGITSPKVGADFRQKILEPGATQKGKDMIKNFLGREPDSRAFLRSIGIIATAES